MPKVCMSSHVFFVLFLGKHIFGLCHPKIQLTLKLDMAWIEPKLKGREFLYWSEFKRKDFIGKNRFLKSSLEISTTNWELGRIFCVGADILD